MMNKTEQKAFQWITEHGYTDIVFRSRVSPDFITAEAVGFEVKKSRNKVVVFTKSQWAALLAYGCTKLMIYNDKVEPLVVVDVKELPIPPAHWRGFNFLLLDKTTSVKFDKEIIERLKALKHPGQSYNGIIEELINEHEYLEKGTKTLLEGFSESDKRNIREAVAKS